MRRHRRAFRLIVQFRSVGRQHGGLVAGLLHTAFHPFRQGLLSPMKRIWSCFKLSRLTRSRNRNCVLPTPTREERVRTMHRLGLKTRKKKNQRTIAAINCNHALKDERYLSAPCRSDVCFAACFEKFGIENQKGIKTSASERSERRQKRKRTHQQFVAALLIHQARCFDLWHRGIFKARDSRFYFTVNSFFLSYFSYLAFSLLCVPFSIN